MHWWSHGCTKLAAIVSVSLLFTEAGLQSQAQSLRPVRNNTIFSPELPRADLIFGTAFRYAGGQLVNLYGMADAEQHLFVKGGDNATMEAFYWVQFEHRVPTDQHTYDYQLGHTTDIGGLSFVYDVKGWDYAAMQNEDPKSDSAAITRLLAKSNLKFPRGAARVRMFHLPTADHRTELMIIYVEALPTDTRVPPPKQGVDLMKESPTLAQKLLENLKSQLTIHAR